MGHWYNPASGDRADFPIAGWLPSVSTILQATQPYSEQQALKNSALRHPFKAAQRLAETSNRGDDVHAWIAAYLQGAMLPELSLRHHPWCHAVRPYLDYLKNTCELSNIETPVFHFDFAGQPDLVVVQGQQRILIDFKTKDRPIYSAALHKAALQLTGYSEAYEYQHREPIDQLLAVIIYPTHTQVESFDCFTHLQEWRNRRGAYHAVASGA